MDTTLEATPLCADAARQKLQGSLAQKRVSLTAGEAAFLKALLLDPVSLDDSDHATQMAQAAKRLENDMLFQVPFAVEPPAQPPKCRRPQSNSIGLWKAFAEGVHPKQLVNEAEEREMRRSTLKKPSDEGTDDADSIKSDEEVRNNVSQYQEDLQYESWDEDETAPEHYDAWAVLKDEYAKDFGFDYSAKVFTAEELDNDEIGNNFRILGTSVDDASAQPHVLSPPLMDALMNFLPSTLMNQNFWLKFSLVRDGASLDTFKRYVRGAKHTILAIETTKGQVFGSFTSAAWTNNPGYYGTGESFLWRMRKTRNNKVYSLFEQAQMENEIDTFPFSGKNEFVQLCTHDRIAVGGGKLEASATEWLDTTIDFGVQTSFGLAIDDDLLNGTTSPCATFLNPCLLSETSIDETFQIVNMECWTLTPCYSVQEAEKLEMTKFFVQQSSRNEKLLSGERSQFSSQELMQPEFYRRVGSNDQSQEGRDRWQYAAMMGTQGLR